MGTNLAKPKLVNQQIIKEDISDRYDLEKGLYKKDEVYIEYTKVKYPNKTFKDDRTILIYLFSNFDIVKREITTSDLYRIYDSYRGENKRKIERLSERTRIVFLMLKYLLRKNKLSCPIKIGKDRVYCKYGYIRYE